MPAACAFASARAACPMICATSRGGERPALDDRVRERLAVEELHHDVRQPLGGDAVVVDVHGVLGLELRRGARLDLEAGARLGLLANCGRMNLIATRVPSVTCTPSQTVPIPPSR